MSENLHIGKETELSDSKLSSEGSSACIDPVPQSTLTEYMIDGDRVVTNKVYLNSKDQGLISDFCLKGLREDPPTYEEELMDEFLSIGRVYESVIYPCTEVQENTGDYQGDTTSDNVGDNAINDNNHGSNQNEDGLEDPDYRESYTQYDYDYLNQLDCCDSDNNSNGSSSETRNEATLMEHNNLTDLKDEGVTIDHDLTDGITSKTYQKEEKYLGRGLDSEIPRHEQPREKALRLGIDALSDAELLALIFGTGIKGQNVLEMSRQILSDNMNHLSLLARLSPQELTMRYKGIGQAKAIMLCAAMALGIRAERDAHSNQMQQIDSSLKAYHLLRPQLQWIEHEEFWVIFLSKSNNLKNCCCISRGGISETVVDVRIVIQRALQESASSMILVHNHPGSLLVPSQQDDQLTTKIADAARFFDIQVLDHIIIGACGYYSYKEHNHMRF